MTPPTVMYDRSRVPLLHRLPMTRIRMAIARSLYRVLRLALRRNPRHIRRHGIRYEVDLSEALDLAVFLFGRFQRHVTDAGYFRLPPDAVVLDVGANFGLLSLRFAQLAPAGRVYAFEPTMYAFRKLVRNLALNPELAGRIIPLQSFVSDTTAVNQTIPAYSSWKVDRPVSSAHPIHGGSQRESGQARVVTLDSFCQEGGLERVDLIKIDTDGHEYPVLRGAATTLRTHRPAVIFEMGIYLMEERQVTFEQYDELLTSFGYRLLNCKNGQSVTKDNYLRQIPLYATTDVLAVGMP